MSTFTKNSEHIIKVWIWSR